jgi:hypothetical protein
MTRRPAVMDAERLARIGKNEALFRQVNERTEQLNEALATFTETFQVVCECGDLDCAQQISIEANEYARVRSDPHLFIVAPHHETTVSEDVVESETHYRIVRKKQGLPQLVAEQTSPD